MQPILEVKNFHKSFGDHQIHKGIDFAVYPNQIISLIGGSGSGKSVLLRALIGLEKPDRGNVFYRGQDVTNFNEEQWMQLRIKIAYVFQGGALFDSLTIEENLLYPLDAHSSLSRVQKQKKIDEILERLGLSKTHQLLPSDLSGGMQKRAGLARSLILDPEVILYDEPTAGLDPFNCRVVEKIICSLKTPQRGGVLVTHEMKSAFITSERLALLKEGKIALMGPSEELKKHKMIQAFVEGENIHGET